MGTMKAVNEMGITMRDPATLARDTKLRRWELAITLTTLGFPITEGTLSNMASRYNKVLKAVQKIKPDALPEPLSEYGPPFRKFGRVPVYDWGPALDWAEGRSQEFVTRPGQASADEIVRREEGKPTLEDLGL
jgi:hypothetical protein